MGDNNVQFYLEKKDALENGYQYDSSTKFINPYNFISLGTGVDRKNKNSDKDEKKLTGYIDCELITKTPLIIPGKKEEKEVIVIQKGKDGDISVKQKHNVYEAFVVNNQPIIPGNSLRGIIRSQFETLSHSCLSTIDEEMRFTTRAESFDFKPGILYEDKLVESTCAYLDFKDFDFIVNQKRILIDLETNEQYKTGDVFYIKYDFVKKSHRNYVTEISFENAEGFTEAILFIGERHPIGGHKYVKLAIVNENAKVVTKDVVRLRKELWAIIEDYNDIKKPSKGNEVYQNIDKKAKAIPVWYKNLGKDKIYVSPAQRGRFTYKRSLKDLLKYDDDSKSYEPCSHEEQLCAACRLFGSVNDNLAVPSRIRVTDATTNSDDCIESDYRTLLPLSSPKFSNPEFYLDYLPNRYDRKYYSYFNYDYYKDENGKINFINSNDLMIRGRKNYWHFKPLDRKDIPQTQLNATFKAIKEETHFNFKVYFDQITEKELKQLIISLNLEDNENNQCYKLGHGKPLGYGSCKIKVRDVKYRDIKKIDHGIQYEIFNFTDRYETYEEAFGKQDRLYYELRTIMKFNALDNILSKGGSVSYPIGSGRNKESFRWFDDNKKSVAKGNSSYTNINQLLPFVSDEYDHIVMHGYYRPFNGNKGNNKHDHRKQGNFKQKNKGNYDNQSRGRR